MIPSELLFTKPWQILQEMHNFLGLSAHRKPEEKIINIQKNEGDGKVTEGIREEFSSKLRNDLDDSYRFATEELGWGSTLPWSWSI